MRALPRLRNLLVMLEDRGDGRVLTLWQHGHDYFFAQGRAGAAGAALGGALAAGSNNSAGA